MTTRPRNIPVEDIRTMAAQADAIPDEVIADAFDRARISYNADTAGHTLLALACLIAHYRPQMLARILREPINCMVCMGVESLQGFWGYASFWVRRDAAAEPKRQRFKAEALEFFSKYPPAKPGALDCEPLKAANRGR